MGTGSRLSRVACFYQMSSVLNPWLVLTSVLRAIGVWRLPRLAAPSAISGIGRVCTAFVNDLLPNSYNIIVAEDTVIVRSTPGRKIVVIPFPSVFHPALLIQYLTSKIVD